jgi:hypothetical protein
MVNSHETEQHTVVTPQRTIADEGDVNVLPYPPCKLAAESRSRRQLLPMPQVPPLASEG